MVEHCPPDNLRLAAVDIYCNPVVSLFHHLRRELSASMAVQDTQLVAMDSTDLKSNQQLGNLGHTSHAHRNADTVGTEQTRFAGTCASFPVGRARGRGSRENAA